MQELTLHLIKIAGTKSQKLLLLLGQAKSAFQGQRTRGRCQPAAFAFFASSPSIAKVSFLWLSQVCSAMPPCIPILTLAETA